MAATESKEPKTRLHMDWLDGIRGAAALYVLFHHCWLELAHLTHGKLISLLRVFSFGHYSVDVFIVLSGFCLFIPVSLKGGELVGGWQRFLVRRALRILPTYYLALAVSLLLVFTVLGKPTNTHWDSALPVGEFAIWTHVLMLQDLFVDTCSKINNAMWSISVEWRIYFLFPFLVLLFTRHNVFKIALATIVIGYALFALLLKTPLNPQPWGPSPYYLGLFTMGMAACELVLGRKHNDVGTKSHVIGASILSLILIAVAGAKFHVSLQVMSLFVGFSAACLMVLIGRGYWKLGHTVFAWKPLALVGTFGYSLYLFHPPLLQLCYQFIARPLGGSPERQTLTLYACSPLVLGGCYLAYLAFERPFVQLLAGQKVTKPTESLAPAEPTTIVPAEPEQAVPTPLG